MRKTSLPLGRYVKTAVCVTIVLTFLSCVSTTGTKTNLTSEELSSIRKAGILVESESPISVRIARDKMTNTGAVFLGLLGAGMEAGYNSLKDSSSEKEIGGALRGFDPVKDSAAAFREKFTTGKVFPVVEIVQTDSPEALIAQGFDAVFKETIEEWGLRLCSGKENVRIGFDIHAQVIMLRNNTTVWERDELYMEGSCRPLTDFSNDGEVLRASLKRATESLAAKIANEIACP